MLRMLKHKFSCEEPRETQAAVVIPTLCCTVKQLIKIGWWQIKSVIQINSKPLFAELPRSHAGFFSDFFPSMCLCLGLSLLPRSISIAKYIWSCHWERWSRKESCKHNGSTQTGDNSISLATSRLPLTLLGQLLTVSNVTTAQTLHPSYI